MHGSVEPVNAEKGHVWECGGSIKRLGLTAAFFESRHRVCCDQTGRHVSLFIEHNHMWQSSVRPASAPLIPTELMFAIVLLLPCLDLC